MQQSRLRLSFVRVNDWERALDLLEVRNLCREGMTHRTDIITINEQSLFYRDHLSPSRGDQMYEAYLLLDDDEPIGFGLLKWDKSKNAYWMTAGIVPEYRGRKLSRFLIAYITEMGHREGAEVWIDVWSDNLALIGDIKVGYELQSQSPEGNKVLCIMKHNRERSLRATELGILANFGQFARPNPPESILREIEEVDQISREALGAS